MYDCTIDSDEHTYYTNGLLSHNTTIATLYILWYALINDAKNICLLSYKEAGALEIMDRFKSAYQSLPIWLQVRYF